MTGSNTPACPYCGSRQPPVVMSGRKGEQHICPECSYVISEWKQFG